MGCPFYLNIVEKNRKITNVNTTCLGIVYGICFYFGLFMGGYRREDTRTMITRVVPISRIFSLYFVPIFRLWLPGFLTLGLFAPVSYRQDFFKLLK
jgi:hypothetical protein